MKNLLTICCVCVLAAGSIAAQAQTSGSCDRKCPEGIADPYPAAMVAHDASRAPFAKNVKIHREYGQASSD